MELNPKQEAFCLEYIKTGNLTVAYQKAYGTKSPGVAASNANRLLKNENVQARLKELRDEMASPKIMDAQEIQERLTAIARRELYEEVFSPNGERARKVTSIRDALKALEILTKIQGLYMTKQELEFKGVVPVVIHDDI